MTENLDCQEQGEYTPTTDFENPVEPSHYKFPNGREVIEISQFLSSMGGQAVQYIARATRIDGRNKGRPVEDLKKAIKVIEVEIERLGLSEWDKIQ